MVTWANGSPHPRLWRERDRVSNATLPHFKCERAVLNRNPSADSKLKGRTQNGTLRLISRPKRGINPSGFLIRVAPFMSHPKCAMNPPAGLCSDLKCGHPWPRRRPPPCDARAGARFRRISHPPALKPASGSRGRATRAATPSGVPSVSASWRSALQAPPRSRRR